MPYCDECKQITVADLDGQAPLCNTCGAFYRFNEINELLEIPDEDLDVQDSHHHENFEEN